MIMADFHIWDAGKRITAGSSLTDAMLIPLALDPDGSPSLKGAAWSLLKANALASPTITGHATIEDVTLTGATGTGRLVLDTAPTIGVLTVTSVNKLTITQPANGATLTIPDGVTLNAGAGGTLGSNAFNSTAFITASSADSLTNKTYDSAGTGNVFKINGAQVSSIGSGLSISGGVLSASGGSGSLTVGTSPIVSGTAGRVLFEDGSNKLNESANLTFDGTILSAPAFVGSGSGAGYLELTQGAAPSLGTNSIQIVAPVSVTPYQLHLVGAAATGIPLFTNVANVVTETIVAPGSSGNVLTSDGTTWTSAAPSGGGTTINATNSVLPQRSNSTTFIDSPITGSVPGSMVDGLTVTGAATANPATVTIAATGSDSNINISVTPKGTGGLAVTYGAIDLATMFAIERPDASRYIRMSASSSSGGPVQIRMAGNNGGGVIGMFDNNFLDLAANSVSGLRVDTNQQVNIAAALGVGSVSTPDSFISRSAAGVLQIGGASADASGSLKLTKGKLQPLTVSTLGTGVAGDFAYVTDGDSSLAWGATIVNSGSGATKYLVFFNGTNWVVAAR